MARIGRLIAALIGASEIKQKRASKLIRSTWRCGSLPEWREAFDKVLEDLERA